MPAHFIGADAAARVKVGQAFVGELDRIFAVFETVPEYEQKHFFRCPVSLAGKLLDAPGIPRWQGDGCCGH